MGCYFLGLLILYRVGYSTLARAVTVGTIYVYCWILIIIFRDPIVGSVALTCSTGVSRF